MIIISLDYDVLSHDEADVMMQGPDANRFAWIVWATDTAVCLVMFFAEDA